MKKRAMFYCQSVLGMGHLIRSAEIARGLADNRFEVSFLNGGETAGGLQLPSSIAVVNLPPIKSDAEFREIRAADGSRDLEEIKEDRRRRILAEFARFRPQVLIIELFPFGRRKFAFELIPLLERISAGGRATKVVCSLRDILVSRRDQARFEDRVCNLMNRYFDLLLVHADPRFQRLEETFPSARRIECPIRYTGFVVQRGDK
jgi:predicted glycosyltransferase